jgi:UDP-glucose 4-epimerase
MEKLKRSKNVNQKFMQKVVVTGGAGYIGSNLCKALHQNNFYPIIVDDLSTGSRDLIKYGDFIEGNIGDYEMMMEIFAIHKPVGIFHIAGSKSVEESVKNPHKYYLNNTSNTNNLLKATVDSGIKYFVFSSTAAIFGIQKDVSQAIAEDGEKKPISPYGSSKSMIEEMLRWYENSHGLCFASLRYFNVTGADPELEMGEINVDSPNLFPVLMRVISGKMKEFTIFGQDYETKDGTCIRDYIHVWDLANAHVVAFNKMLQDQQSFVVNLGNGVGFSIRQVIEVFKEVTGNDFNVKLGDRRPGDPAQVISNIAFAKKYLQWQPKFTSLQDHVRHAWFWYEKITK